jgi:phosphate-selective porin O/P
MIVPGRCVRRGRAAALTLVVLALGRVSAAQAPPPVPVPAPSPAPPKPAEAWFKLGATIFSDFTYQAAPRVTDSDKALVRKSEFEVRRAYINLTGGAAEVFSFRITPDVAARQSTGVSGTGLPADLKVGSSVDGSLTVRIKYAFAQVSFDKMGPAGKGAWIRLGQQQTPYIDFMEGIYRYRFQGTGFAERVGLLSSSDVGVSGHYELPHGYGDVHAGVYNGETYTKPEVNGQKAFQIRGSLRPLPDRARLKGLRVHAFYDRDAPVAKAARNRLATDVTFEHPRLNFGAHYLRAHDRPSALSPVARAKGWSVWVTPRPVAGLEGLFRYDHYQPNTAVAAFKREVIVGASYWFRRLKAPQAVAVLADYDRVDYDLALGKPDERRWELKALLGF